MIYDESLFKRAIGIFGHNLLGQIVSEHGLRQYRTAETEKYPHVTYQLYFYFVDNFSGKLKYSAHDKLEWVSIDEFTKYDFSINSGSGRNISRSTK